MNQQSITRMIGTVAVALFLSSCASTAQVGALDWAHTAYGKGDYDNCLKYLSHANSYGSFSEAKDAEISFYRGLCLEGQGRRDEAMAVYKNVTSKYPGTDWAAQAKAKLGE